MIKKNKKQNNKTLPVAGRAGTRPPIPLPLPVARRKRIHVKKPPRALPDRPKRPTLADPPAPTAIPAEPVLEGTGLAGPHPDAGDVEAALAAVADDGGAPDLGAAAGAAGQWGGAGTGLAGEGGERTGRGREEAGNGGGGVERGRDRELVEVDGEDGRAGCGGGGGVHDGRGRGIGKGL